MRRLVFESYRVGVWKREGGCLEKRRWVFGSEMAVVWKGE